MYVAIAHIGHVCIRFSRAKGEHAREMDTCKPEFTDNKGGIDDSELESRRNQPACDGEKERGFKPRDRFRVTCREVSIHLVYFVEVSKVS